MRVLVRISYEPLAGGVMLLLAVRGTRALGRALAQAGFSCWQAHGVTMQESLYVLGSQSSCPCLSGILRSGLCGWQGVGLGDCLFISLLALLSPPELQDPLVLPILKKERKPHVLFLIWCLEMVSWL